MNCKDCKYYAKSLRNPGGCGYCHKSSPQISGDNVVGQQYIGIWPQVKDDDWCGEFRKSRRAATQQSKPK